MIHQKFWQLLATIILLCTTPATALSPDNACTFHIGGKLFSLIYLQGKQPYRLAISPQESIYINFCEPFVPEECSLDTTTSAYSFRVKEIEPRDPLVNSSEGQAELSNQSLQNAAEVEQNPQYECRRYSSNSYSYYFHNEYEKKDKLGVLTVFLYTEGKSEIGDGIARQTVVQIECSDDEGLNIEKFQVFDRKIKINAHSLSACPVFEVSNIWAVFTDNQMLFGVILFVLGLYMLFYGRVTVEMTIFVAAFFISFAVLGSIFTLFVSPYSSTFKMYFFFLILLVICTLIGYGVTRLVNISIFFVGAFLGFIIGMLVNSIFCKMFEVYSLWSLVIFEIIFVIPFGIMTFKFRDEIIIASSSLTGSYLVIRPISWIFGGFPNEFLLYHLIETNELDTLPWSFFGYLILIVALAIVGAMYQLLKLYRESPEDQIEVNALQEAIEEPADKIKQKVDQLIERFKSDDGENKEYKKMKEMKEKPKNEVSEEF